MYKYLKIVIVLLFIAKTSLAMEPTNGQPLSLYDRVLDTSYGALINTTSLSLIGFACFNLVDSTLMLNGQSGSIPQVAAELCQVVCLTFALDDTIKTCKRFCDPYIKNIFRKKNKKITQKPAFSMVKVVDEQLEKEMHKLHLTKNVFSLTINVLFLSGLFGVHVRENGEQWLSIDTSQPYISTGICLSTLGSLCSIYQIIKNDTRLNEVIIFNFFNNAALFNLALKVLDLNPFVLGEQIDENKSYAVFYPGIALCHNALSYSSYALLLRELYKMFDNGKDYFQECEAIENETRACMVAEVPQRRAKKIQDHRARMREQPGENLLSHFSSALPEEKYHPVALKVKLKKRPVLRASALEYGRDANVGREDEKEKKLELGENRKALLEKIKTMKQPVAEKNLFRLLNDAKKLHKNVQESINGNIVTIKWWRADGTERSIWYELNHRQSNESAAKWKGYKLKRALRAAVVLVLDGMPKSIVNEYCEGSCQNFKWPELVKRVLFEKAS
jgi:hypothetical protein